MGMSVVLVGSPLSGFVVYGPFKTLDDAEEWAGNVEDNEAWATQLEAVIDYRAYANLNDNQ